MLGRVDRVDGFPAQPGADPEKCERERSGPGMPRLSRPLEQVPSVHERDDCGQNCEKVLWTLSKE